MLVIHRPEYEELWFKQLMMSDTETMAYNHAYGGTIPFPKAKWREWYNRWFTDDGKRYYRYLKDDSGRFIGEIAYYYDEDANVFLANVVILAEYRRRGYGNLALDMLCSVAKENGVAELYDEIAIDNPAIRLFLNKGFSEEFRTEKSVMLRKKL